MVSGDEPTDDAGQRRKGKNRPKPIRSQSTTDTRIFRPLHNSNLRTWDESVKWLRDFCGSQSCIVMHGTAVLSVNAS
jgi:hypothetical protein